MTDTHGEERRAMTAEWIKRTDEQLADARQQLTEGAMKLKTLDDGQLHIIKQLDEHGRRLDEQDKGIARAVEVSELTLRSSEKTLDQTKTIRELSENMQEAGRFFNAVAAAFANLGRAVHDFAKFVWPIVALAVILWGIYWAITHDGKPPSIGG